MNFLNTLRLNWLLIVLALTLSASFATANELKTSNTLILPLKIFSSETAKELEQESDRIFADASANYFLISRTEATRKINYSGNWPPALVDLQQLSQSPDTQYVAVGTLSQLGSNLSIDIQVIDLVGNESPHLIFTETDDQTKLTELIIDSLNRIKAYTARSQRIADIKISGNHKIDTGAIMVNINNRAGDDYNIGQLRHDLKTIFKMGCFDDVRIKVDDSNNGKIVTFVVTEKKVIDNVQIKGEDVIKVEELRDVLSVEANTIINPGLIRQSVGNLKNLYREKGFYNCRVEPEIKETADNKVTVIFQIEEGDRTYVRGIDIQGNKSFSDSVIEKILMTTTKNWLSWVTDAGMLRQGMLNQDAARIAAFYQNKGFVDVRVADPVIGKNKDGLHITFKIDEGHRYRVGLINITGDIETSLAEMLALTNIGNEKFFNRKTLRDDVMALTDFYAVRGYAFADVNPQITKKEAEKRIDINFDANKGSLVHINRIIIKGNNRTRDKIIRRTIKVGEQDIYDAAALRKSSEKLQRLNYFSDINIEPEPAHEEGLMDVVVSVKEKATGTFSIGGGYSSLDGFMFMTEISQNNFLGRGQKLALQANLGGANTRYNINFTEPHLNDSKLLFGFDIFNWDREYDDYDKNSKGFSFRLGYPLWDRWRLYGTIGYDETKLEDVDLATASTEIIDSMDIETTHSYTITLSRDTRNHVYNPNKGSKHRVSLKKASSFLGGDAAYTKIEGTSSWYFPYRWDTVFHVKGAAGYVRQDTGGELPIYEHFYLGGINSMRGFESGQISPIDPATGDRVGGDKMAYVNLEYIFPLLEDMGLTGVVFYDTGCVYSAEDDWTMKDLRKSVGFGFRWLSPMGPLRLEWGYNIDPIDDEEQSLWDFTIGGQM